MRIGQIAELAGTTTRAVRHYHRIGLLAEPERLPNGFRDYDMSAAIRLMRIRWLADGGVPLETIAGVLDGGDPETAPSPSPPASSPVGDLRALVSSIDEQITVLSRRRDRLTQLLQDAEAGRSLSPLLPALADLFEHVITLTEAPAVRSALRKERELVETLVMSGRAPEGFLAGFAAVLGDPARRTRYLDLLARWSALENRAPEEVGEEIAAVSAEIAELMSPLRVPDVDGPLPLLDDVVPDPAQQDVITQLRGRLRREREASSGPAP